MPRFYAPATVASLQAQLDKGLGHSSAYFALGYLAVQGERSVATAFESIGALQQFNTVQPKRPPSAASLLRLFAERVRRSDCHAGLHSHGPKLSRDSEICWELWSSQLRGGTDHQQQLPIWEHSLASGPRFTKLEGYHLSLEVKLRSRKPTKSLGACQVSWSCSPSLLHQVRERLCCATMAVRQFVRKATDGNGTRFQFGHFSDRKSQSRRAPGHFAGPLPRPPQPGPNPFRKLPKQRLCAVPLCVSETR